jgi:hypothetical protein
MRLACLSVIRLEFDPHAPGQRVVRDAAFEGVEFGNCSHLAFFFESDNAAESTRNYLDHETGGGVPMQPCPKPAGDLVPSGRHRGG